jgi:hypothetical protein
MHIKTAIPVLMLSGCLLGSLPAQKSQSIETALKRRLITCRGSVEVLYSGQKLKLEVKNRSRDTVVFHVDPGQIFTPTNAAYQPLIATRQKTIRLAPGEERPVYVNALCGDQPKMSASDGTTDFTMGGRASSALAAMLQQIQELGWEKNINMQNLVWAFTNDMSIASLEVEGLDALSRQKLMRSMTTKSGQSEPWYQIKYRPADPSSPILFSGIADEIKGDLKYELAQTDDIRIQVIDAQGRIQKTLVFIPGQAPGRYTLPLKFAAEELPLGQYSVRVEGRNALTYAKFNFEI